MTTPSSGLESTKCPLCGSDDPDPVCEKGQFGLPTHVVVCKRCGFSYLSPRWSKERYDRFYREEYDRYYRPEVLAQNDDRSKYGPVKAIVARLFERGLLRPFTPVLDLGSGMGHALIHLRDLQHGEGTFEAIEPSQTCRDHLISNGIRYVSDDVYSDWEAGREKRYDLVIMRHVLEHFHDPLTILGKVRRTMTGDGLLYIAVPDAMHPTKPLRSHFFRVVHISYFTKASLSAMLRMAGLEPIHVSEGDHFDRHEVFALCRTGVTDPFTPNPAEHDQQMDVYRLAGKWDAYHELKARSISLLRRLHLIR